MSITEIRDDTPITGLKLEAANSAKIYANYQFMCARVAFDRDKLNNGNIAEHYWHFDAKACHEAAEFFLRLADEIKARS